MDISFDRFGMTAFKTDEGEILLSASLILVDTFRFPVTVSVYAGRVFLPKLAKGGKIEGEMGFEIPIFEHLKKSKKAQALFNQNGGKGSLTDSIGKGIPAKES